MLTLNELKEEEISSLMNLFKEVFEKNDIHIRKKENLFTKYFVLKKENDIIGFINFDLIYDRMELIQINVLEEYQNQGYGRKMMDFMIGFDSDIANITLEVNEKNENAIHLYEKCGFKKIAIRKNYYGSDNGILMEKEMK